MKKYVVISICLVLSVFSVVVGVDFVVQASESGKLTFMASTVALVGVFYSQFKFDRRQKEDHRLQREQQNLEHEQQMAAQKIEHKKQRLAQELEHEKQRQFELAKERRRILNEVYGKVNDLIFECGRHSVNIQAYLNIAEKQVDSYKKEELVGLANNQIDELRETNANLIKSLAFYDSHINMYFPKIMKDWNSLKKKLPEISGGDFEKRADEFAQMKSILTSTFQSAQSIYKKELAL